MIKIEGSTHCKDGFSMSMPDAYKTQKRALHLMELELWMVVSHVNAGTEFRSSVRVASVLTAEPFLAPALILLFLTFNK